MLVSSPRSCPCKPIVTQASADGPGALAGGSSVDGTCIEGPFSHPFAGNALSAASWFLRSTLKHACAVITQSFDDSDDSDDDDDGAAYVEDVDMSDDWQLTGPDVGEDALEYMTEFESAGGMDDFPAAQQQGQQQPVLPTAGGGGYGMMMTAPGSRGFQLSMLVCTPDLAARKGAAQQPSCHAARPLLDPFFDDA